MTKTRTDGSVTMHGPVEFYIVTRANIPDLVERAAARDVGARTTLRGINGFVIAQLETKRGKGRMCLMCDFEFNQKSAQPGAFVVMLPMFPGQAEDNDADALLCPVCERCVDQYHADFEEAMIVRFHELWGDLDIQKITQAH